MIEIAEIARRFGMLFAMAVCVLSLTRLFSSTPENDTSGLLSTMQTGDFLLASLEQNGSREIDYLPVYSALDTYTTTSVDIVQPIFNPSVDYWGLPKSVGYENVAAYCSTCHTLQIIMQQRLSRHGWDYLLSGWWKSRGWPN